MGNPKLQFRLDDQDSGEIERRKMRDTVESDIARRDLRRYYTLLRVSLPTFTEEEALLLCEAMKEPFTLHPSDVRLLWAEVSNAYRLGRLKHRKVDVPALVDRLRDLTAFECMAIYDAIEQFWHSEYFHRIDLDDTEILLQIGLIAKEQSRRNPMK